MSGLESWPMLLACLVVAALAGRDAWLDRSPRDPVARKAIYTPQLWWARRRTRREVSRNSVDITTPVTAPMVAGRHPFRRFWNGHLPTRRRSARTGR